MVNRFLPIIYNLARLNILFSCLLWAPALASYYFGDGLLETWLFTSLVMIISSFIIRQLTKKYNRELQARDGFLLAFLLWILFAFAASIPIYFSDSLSFTDAYFEAISGLTTTGSSVFANVEHLQPSLNLWRHMLNWFGGMGIIVLAVAIIPTLGIGGMNILRAEITGVNKDKKLTPRIAQTAKSLWGIYIIFTVIVVIVLKLAGMSWFDAVCHAFSSISLGGFSTYSDSIGHFNSVTIEIILMITMLIGAISFLNHIMVIKNRSLIIYWKDEEVRIFLKVLLLSILISTVYLWYMGFYGQGLSGFLTSLRYVAFNYVSIGTACGFSSVDFTQWPIYVGIIMYMLANILSNSGSTGGGIKMIRIIIQFKFMYREMLLLIHPNAVKTVKVNGNIVPNKISLNVMAFILVYLMTVVIATLILLFTGVDAVSAFSFIIASITNAGPGLGYLGPMADLNILSDFQKWVCAFTMLIGRLEIFTVFILFLPVYWES
ncbi:MAG: TrkH family potassium uptake protein [Neisseriaceae bacterium]|nr:MAG: TrkH family potassium uptake protein [Neisseriaceae bacterium]